MPAAIKQTGMVPLDLYAGFRIVLEARDPATDTLIAGVQLSDIVLYASHQGQGSLPDVLPHWLYQEFGPPNTGPAP